MDIESFLKDLPPAEGGPKYSLKSVDSLEEDVRQALLKLIERSSKSSGQLRTLLLEKEFPVQLVDQMIDRFYIAAKNTGIDKGFKNYSPYELLIIASMVQSEGDLTDFPKIARVIYNRLEIGMPLQINATIDYATNTRGKIRLPYKRLDTNSKYNTYKYRGLPPGPISNPGEKALEATVNPASGDWLYYVTVKPNDTRFTKSFDQFNIWANEFRKNEDAGLFN